MSWFIRSKYIYIVVHTQRRIYQWAIGLGPTKSGGGGTEIFFRRRVPLDMLSLSHIGLYILVVGFGGPIPYHSDTATGWEPL